MSQPKRIPAVQSVVEELLADLYAKSGCEKIGLTREAFATILCEVGSSSFTAATSESEIRTFLLSLRVDELALARACAAGRTLPGNFSLRVIAKSFIFRPFASRGKIPPPANWLTLFTPIYTARTPATASVSPNLRPTLGGDRWRAGCARFWRRNM